ncbi:Dynein heavy chain 6, axonemal [Phlyctochytrium planicorne]|nr:Dynein heavy chain 6, axonemal [Phlyctochytrium planicorne]
MQGPTAAAPPPATSSSPTNSPDHRPSASVGSPPRPSSSVPRRTFSGQGPDMLMGGAGYGGSANRSLSISGATPGMPGAAGNWHRMSEAGLPNGNGSGSVNGSPVSSAGASSFARKKSGIGSMGGLPMPGNGGGGMGGGMGGPIVSSAQQRTMERKAARTALVLSQRLYTVSSKPEGPRFTVGAGRRGDQVLAVMTPQQALAMGGVTRLEPLGDIVLSNLPSAAEPLEVTFRPKILRAKRSHVIPSSSHGRRALRGSGAQHDLGVDPSQDEKTLRSILRPQKRTISSANESEGTFDDEDDQDNLLIHKHSMFVQPVIPPISPGRKASIIGKAGSRRGSARSRRPSNVPTSAGSDSSNTPIKRVRMTTAEKGEIKEEDETERNLMQVCEPGEKKLHPALYVPKKKHDVSFVDHEQGLLSAVQHAQAAPAESGELQMGTEDVFHNIKEQSKDPFKFIEFLQAHPHSKDFAYMNIIKPSVKQGNLTFNPYNLEIVDFSQVDKRYGYYTISNSGVTHFNAIGHGDFTPLSQWLRECGLFHSLLKIPFFARYRVWKCFTLWKRTVLHTKIMFAKKLLIKNLFTVHPILRNSLLSIRQLCVDVLSQRRFINIHEQRCYYLDEFVKEQKDWVEETSKNALKEFHASVKEIVEKAGKECLIEKGFDVQLKEADEDEDGDIPMDDDSKGRKKLEASGADVLRLTFTEQAARRSECRRLQRFVKLVDYILINTLHMLTVESIKELLKSIFRGCADSDVLVQLMNERIGAMTEEIGSSEDIAENSGKITEPIGAAVPATTAPDPTAAILPFLERAGLSPELISSLHVGGIVVGPEVGTSELITGGFDGFPIILSRILRSTVLKLEVVEIIEEDGPTSDLKQNAMDVDDKRIAKIVSQPAASKAAAHEEKSTKVDLTADLKKKLAAFVPLFRVELLLNQNSEAKDLYFAPSLPDYLTAVDLLVRSFIATVEEIAPLTNTIPYLDPANLAGGAYSSVRGLEDNEYVNGPQATEIITEGGYFKEVCGRIRGALVGIFTNATKWMQTMEEVRKMWVENEGFNCIRALEEAAGRVPVILASNDAQSLGEGGVAALLMNTLNPKENQGSKGDLANEENGSLRAESRWGILEMASTIATKPDGTVYSPLVDFFETSLSTFANQKQTMNQISMSSVINNLNVDIAALKAILAPSPERCFSDVSNILPGLARDKNELLLGEVQYWVRILNTQPSSVEGFVEYLGWLDRVKDSLTMVEQFNDEVTRLYALLDIYKIPIQPTDLALFQTLGPTLRQLRESVDMATDTKEENISRFSGELDKSMAELMQEVSEIRNRAQDPMVLNPGAKCEIVIKFLEDLRSQLDKIDTLKSKYEQWGELFRSGGVASNSVKVDAKFIAAPGANKGNDLEETRQEVELKRTLWVSLKEWENLTESWKSQPFDTLSTDDVNTQITAYLKTVYTLDKGLPPNEVVPKLKAMVDEYRNMYSTIVDLRNPALKQRHWEKIQDALGKSLVKDETFTLGKLIELRVFDFKEEIGNISSQAGSEAALEEMLAKVVKTWNEAEFLVIGYRDSKDVFILGSIDDIQTLLEDSQVTIATIKGSRFIGPIKSEIERWDKQLSLFADTLDAWLTCQRNWLYLESIFSAPDIQRQLPDEARMFSQVDRTWKDVMRKVYRNSNAMKSGTMPGLLETMQQNNSLLDQIQKCLEDYLESKRLLFPRFYFLSNEELLEILSQTRNPHAVQPHLSKCFDAIKSLEFSSSDPKSIDIIAMLSPEGERVPFTKTIKARGNVEAWLGSVEEAMVTVLRRLLKSALAEYDDRSRSDWLRDHVGQVVVAGNQIIWCRDVSEAIKSVDPNRSLNALRQKCVNNLAGTASLVRGELTKIQRAILGAVITIDVHNRDIVQGLINSKVTGLADFEWTKQMRYYWDMDSDTCNVKMSSTVFSYGYEYLGCSPRLVITPLTDRCYLTLTGAMQLNLGGSPVGPAGTGKTETVKDLAKALARQCVVFNCSDGLDYKMMGKMFAGLAQSGAWCCFDEFNRIDIEVLSVIAQQLLTIKSAKDMKATKFIFEGREIRLIETCAAFITMNPGYAGRTELPDNLKALFRPIAMMIPDYGLIAEIMLFSEGFENAKVLAGKVVNLYKLCSEQLSQQDHYDFGMRAVKSVLIMAGALKRANPDLSEDVVLIRSLRDSNLPKFLAEDVGLFKGILQDLFPSVNVPEKDFEILSNTIQEIMKERNLEIVQSAITRTCQLYETMKIRHGVMLVGPTGGGKTTCYEVLKDASIRIKERTPSTQDFQKIKTWVLNPKCVAMTELYGEFNLATMEWKDGLIGSIFRTQVADNSPDEKWTVCDGPVDALWIENMNTVLDDNKLLTLINGERIKMSNTMHMLFEVMDLAVASPATVSRCGMVYMDPASLGWMPYVKSWLRKLPDHVSLEARDFISSLFEKYVDKGLSVVRRSCREYLPSVNINLVISLCNLLGTFLNRTGGDIDFHSDYSDLRTILGHIFVFCFVWSIGGNIADGVQDFFDSFVRDLFETQPLPDVQLPSSNNIFCYYVDIKHKTFALWDDLVPAFTYSPDIPYFKMIVPTAETIKYSFLMDALLTNGSKTLFTGNTGVGKSIIIQDLLNRSSKQKGYVPITLNFSAQTNSLQTQQIIELKLEKKRKNILGPPAGSNKVVLFIDDLNMPKLDSYGSQPPIELLRQYLDFGGFYDREKLFWKVIQDVEIVASCAPPGGGRNNVTPRFLRQFNMLNIPVPSELTLAKIFRSIVDGFFKSFTMEIKSLGEAIVNSAIEIYRCMCTELLPTPAKSHYTFNLRDLSKVIQGILQVQPTTISSKVDMVRLFCHEASRVFYDRLIDDTDRMYFNKLMSELTEKNLGVMITKDSLIQKPIMFGDFGKRGVPVEERQYIEFTDNKVLSSLLEEYLEEYNVTMSKDVRLIFFMDAQQHITRISRIIRQPRGNALLVGVGGTGKQSLTRLACHISDYQCISIELTRTYGETEWREDIKRLYHSAGVEGKNTVFLISDTQIKTEIFLEDINNILNSGEVPNLFEFDEREKILGEIRPIAREKGIPEDRDSVYHLFIDRVRDNLHIVFATSPVGDTFRTRCRMFPSLVNCCTIDWFDEWPKDALLSVSQRFFEFVDLGGAEMRDKISEMCVEIHTSVSTIAKRYYAELRRRYYTTPTSYLELINLYIAMLQEKRKELGSARDRLRNGLNKLAETNDLVAAMQIELQQLGPELKTKAADVETLMIKIAKDQEMADGVRKVVSEEEAVVREQAKATEAIASEAQRDLDEALPALQAAYKSLETLDKKDIAELKVFTKPPDLVLMVMEAICILFKVKPDWDNSKKLLSDPQFMRKMTEYDKDNIPDSISKKLRKYVENPSFNMEAVEKVSKACKSMVMWVIAMDIYSRVFKEVAPKKKRLEEAQTSLEVTRSKLMEKTAALQEVENQLNKLKEKYETSIKSKKTLAEKMEETTRRLARASQLTLALADEQIRWTESIQSLNDRLDALVGNIFLCAAAVAYFGAFTSTYRQELVHSWIRKCQDIGIPVSESFSFIENLADPSIVRDWNIQGLPADALSTENGILVTRGRRWPLMIDPQGQANKWIRNMEGSELRIVKLSEPKFLRSLENAVRTGSPVLLEDVGEVLDPALEPLLLKQTIRQGGRLLMKLGDSMVEYDRNFKLYITTKLSNPHYLPEVCIKVTVINFTVTKIGLEGQLLADVVKLEKPELEEQRNSLIVSIANDKKQLKDIEEKILKLLFNSEGNILDDEELINTLNQSKVTSAAIKERVAQAEITEKEINTIRERYRPVAIRGSVLYFVMADLAEIDPMYQFSLNYFKHQFNQCIIESERADDLDRRIEILCKNSTFSIFSNVSRGLFEAHKLLYSFMICVAIMRQGRDIDELEWNFFLRGSGKITNDFPPKLAKPWMTPFMWQNCVDLSRHHPKFGYLLEHLQNNAEDWDEYIEDDNPFLCSVPGSAGSKLSDFQRLILVKVLREEKLVATVLEFVKRNLGQEFIDIPPLDLAKVYKDTSHKSPMIFILSSGSDPISALLKFAGSKDINMVERLHMISLGQGQGPIAEELLRRATSKGDWVFLQNCHLAASWMSRLEVLVKELSSDNEPHPNFRLFLSSMPSRVFPAAVLQDGVKVTNEPPKGLRANLARSFADISRDLFDDAPPQGIKFKKLLFGICFFNAIIHERKKFGPLGWNIIYDWSNSDLEVSISILKNILRESKSIPWDALLYLTGEITFGGRVTDDWDRRTLKSLLSRYYTPQILDDNHKLSPSGIYYAPADGDILSFRVYIDSLPFSEDPTVFGMHENANVSYQMQESRRLVKTVLDVQPRLISGSGGSSSEEIVVGIATTILDAWPEPIIIDLTGEISIPGANIPGRPENSRMILEQTFKKDENGRMLNSLSTVLSQETVRFNKLLGLVKKSLENIVKAVKGIIVMSSDLELVFKSLLNNEVPASWSAAAYPSLKPLGSWVKDFHLRIEELSNWVEKGQPTNFWLPGFFFPQGFLTGVLQNHARKYNIPIDSLLFAFKVSEYEDGDPRIGNENHSSDTRGLFSGDVTGGQTQFSDALVMYPEEDGVLVRGLFVEGARWDRQKRSLQDSYPMEMYSTMPLIRFIPTQIPQSDASLYVCPLYKTSARAGTLSTTGHSTNFVISVNIPSDKPQDYWISKGVALLVRVPGIN